MSLTLKVLEEIIELRVLLVISVIVFGRTLFQNLGIPFLVRFYLDYFRDVYAFSFVDYDSFPAFSFLLGPALMFGAVYLLFSKEFPRKTASILTSIIFGSVLGRWLAVIALSGTFLLLGSSVQLTTSSSVDFYATVIDLLVGFLAFSIRNLFTQWDARLVESGIHKSARPNNIFLLTALNFIVGILAFTLVPVLAALSSLSRFGNFPVALLLAFFGPLAVGNVVLQILVGYGLLKGWRWSWIVALIVSLVGAISAVSFLLSVFTALPLRYYLVSFPPDPSLTANSIVTVALGFVVLALLMRKDSRLYYRVVNPSMPEEQNTTSEKIARIS